VANNWHKDNNNPKNLRYQELLLLVLISYVCIWQADASTGRYVVYAVSNSNHVNPFGYAFAFAKRAISSFNDIRVDMFGVDQRVV
jgi:hypothetical protein